MPPEVVDALVALVMVAAVAVALGTLALLLVVCVRAPEMLWLMPEPQPATSTARTPASAIVARFGRSQGLQRNIARGDATTVEAKAALAFRRARHGVMLRR